MFIPSCDEDGYFRKLQCDQSRAECWCADLHGTEVPGSRVRGKPDCGECHEIKAPFLMKLRNIIHLYILHFGKFYIVVNEQPIKSAKCDADGHNKYEENIKLQYYALCQ